MKLRVLAIGAALCLTPASAVADRHSCDQLRLLVDSRLPAISRDLPYDALDCDGISEVYLLLVRYDGTLPMLDQRIEAIFRRHGLID